MDTEQQAKAKRMIAAFEKAEAQYIAEGNPKMARLIANAKGQLPVGSLARLHDIITRH